MGFSYKGYYSINRLSIVMKNISLLTCTKQFCIKKLLMLEPTKIYLKKSFR